MKYTFCRMWKIFLLQVQHSHTGAAPKYAGPMDVFRKLYKEGGIRSIYRGTFATLLRGRELVCLEGRREGGGVSSKAKAYPKKFHKSWKIFWIKKNFCRRPCVRNVFGDLWGSDARDDGLRQRPQWPLPCKDDGRRRIGRDRKLGSGDSAGRP